MRLTFQVKFEGTSISEKSVEAAIRKLVDEGYIKRHGTVRNTFYAKLSS